MEHYQKLERDLLDILAALLPETLKESEAGEIRYFVDHGEYGLALETLCDVVEEEDRRLPPEVYDKVRKLGASMGMEPEVERRLRGFVLDQRKTLEQ